MVKPGLKAVKAGIKVGVKVVEVGVKVVKVGVKVLKARVKVGVKVVKVGVKVVKMGVKVVKVGVKVVKARVWPFLIPQCSIDCETVGITKQIGILFAMQSLRQQVLCVPLGFMVCWGLGRSLAFSGVAYVLHRLTGTRNRPTYDL